MDGKDGKKAWSFTSIGSRIIIIALLRLHTIKRKIGAKVGWKHNPQILLSDEGKETEREIDATCTFPKWFPLSRMRSATS